MEVMNTDTDTTPEAGTLDAGLTADGGAGPLVPALPQTLLARRALDLILQEEPAPIAHHSIRSALFARMLADHRRAEPGRDYDPELLFLACALHDIGLSELGNRHQRFEVDGADTAAEFLSAQGLPAAQVDAVWQAIALHSSPGIAERTGTLCELVRLGVGMDFGRDSDFVSDQTGAAIHAAYPRLSMATSLIDAIVAQGRQRPEKAPAYTLPGQLLRERLNSPTQQTVLETATSAARWGN